MIVRFYAMCITFWYGRNRILRLTSTSQKHQVLFPGNFEVERILQISNPSSTPVKKELNTSSFSIVSLCFSTLPFYVQPSLRFLCSYFSSLHGTRSPQVRWIIPIRNSISTNSLKDQDLFHLSEIYTKFQEKKPTRSIINGRTPTVATASRSREPIIHDADCQALLCTYEFSKGNLSYLTPWRL